MNKKKDYIRNGISRNPNYISNKENDCKSYIDGEKVNNGQDGWDILPESPPQLLTYCDEDKTGATINNFIVEKTYSLFGTYTDGLIFICNSNFYCNDSKFKYCGVKKEIQLIHIIHKGNHTITNTEFKFCGIEGGFKDASLIEVGGGYAIETVFSNLTFSHNYQNEVPEPNSYLFKCYRAIKCIDDVPITISDSTFYNSSCQESGGSIRFETARQITITRCDFKQYGSHESGGSIYIFIKGPFNIDDCNFTNCIVDPIYGGAIYAQIDAQIDDLKDFIIQNCHFENNNANSYGSAIYFDFKNYYSHLNLSIINNEIQKSTKNVIYIYHDSISDNQRNPFYVKISDNHIFNCGNSIILYIYDKINTNLKIIGNIIENVNNYNEPLMKFENKNYIEMTFEKNCFRNIETYKQNMFETISTKVFSSNDVTVTWFDCSFININNKEKFGPLGNIYDAQNYYAFKLSYTYNKCEFINNKINGKGGAIYIDNPDQSFSIFDSNFVDNTANEGGAVFIQSSKQIDIKGCTFHCNHAESGYSITIISSNTPKLTIDSCIIENENGGLFIDYSSQMTVEIVNVTFDNSTLFIKQTNQNSQISIDDCTFTNCTDQNSLCFDLSIQATSFTLKNNTMTNLIGSSTKEYFGIIKSSFDKLEIQEMKFINNNCNFLYGGGFGIQFESITDLSFINCEFINNKAEHDESNNRMPSGSNYKYYNGDGGGIQIGFSSTINNKIDQIKFDNCTFRENKAFRHGGAIALQGIKNIDIINCNFISNTANYQIDSSSHLLFENNFHLKKEGRGGALYFNPAYCYNSQKCDNEKVTTNVNIDNCLFLFNKAYDGYAIFIEGENPPVTFTITNNNFTNNYNLQNPRSDSAIIASEICIFNEKELIDSNVFSSLNNGEKVNVMIVSCVDQRGKLKPSRKFTKSQEFSKSNPFSNTALFTLTGHFSKSNKFSSSFYFSQSHQFSKSNNFPSTNYFKETDKFTPSEKFTKSQKFSKTNDFTSSTKFSKSNDFSPSAKFSKTNDFSSSKEFSQTQQFTSSFYFSESKKFTKSEKFSNSNHFTNSEFFSQSIDFTSSIQPTPIGGDDCFVDSEEGNYTIHPCYFTNSQDTTVIVKVLLSNFTDFIEKDSGASIRIINGGFNCMNATFNHCISTEGGGGAIYIKNSIDLSNEVLFENSSFIKCQALFGGAVYIYFSSENKNINIRSCNFSDNTALRQYSTYKNELFGGSHLFITAKNVNITNSNFKKGIGKYGCVKIYLVFDDDSKYKLLNDNKNLISISGCDFDLEKNERSSISFIDVKDSSKMTIADCNFVGKLSPNTHYIDGKVGSNVNNIKIESCQFEYQNDLAMNIEIINDDLLTKTDKNNNSQKIIIILSVSLFTISFIFIVLKLSKLQFKNNNY